jgi:hypothetical protein
MASSLEAFLHDVGTLEPVSRQTPSPPQTRIESLTAASCSLAVDLGHSVVMKSLVDHIQAQPSLGAFCVFDNMLKIRRHGPVFKTCLDRHQLERVVTAVLTKVHYCKEGVGGQA